LTARRYRYHPARYMKGPPQVHPRSVGGQRKLARTAQLEAGLSVAGRCILQLIRRPGRRALLPGVVSPKRYPDISSALATARRSHGPCVGQSLDPPVIFPEPDGFFTEDCGPSKSRSKRFGEPPASAFPAPSNPPKCAPRPGP